MSDSGKAIFPDFSKLVPGFDFLQNLTQQSGGATPHGMSKLPNLGSWVAPTLNVEELDKRIQELKAVQFWLDQNATALKATIQALEVQKMTLAALQGMNVNMADMAKAFQMPDVSSIRGMSAGPAAAPVGTEKGHHHFAGLEVPETSFMRREHEREQARADVDAGAAAAAQGEQNNHAGHGSPAQEASAEAVKAEAAMAAVIDPMQWWGALTQQFQTIANSAMQDAAQRKPFEVGQKLVQEAMRAAGSPKAAGARKAAPARAGAVASDKASTTRSKATPGARGSKTAKPSATTTAKASRASSGSKARSASAARKTTPRAR